VWREEITHHIYAQQHTTDDMADTNQQHELDNVMWESLQTRHKELAVRDGNRVVRYPADVAPFFGVPSDTQSKATTTTKDEAEYQLVNDDESLERLVPPGDLVYCIGVPARLSNKNQSFVLEGPVMLHQLAYLERLDEIEGQREIVPLVTDQHRKDVLELAAMVYPHYFRPNTMLLGRYFGIYEEDGVLAAMIGERMATREWQEVSAVCSNPNYNGKGHARRLLVWLSNDILSRGLKPFLHVSPQNTRAKALYDRNGYKLRREVPFWSLKRVVSNTDAS